MNTIKFSYSYLKLWGQTRAKLVAVEPITIDGGLDQELSEYDTKTTGGEYYPLPDGVYLQLIFLGDKNIPFSTIRRMTYDKMVFYKDRLGKWFEIVIAKEAGK